MRRLWACLFALVLAWVVPLMAAAPTLGQHFTIVANSGSTAAVSATSLTTGSTLVCVALQLSAAAARTYTCDGSTNGSYTSIVRTTGGTIPACELFYFKNNGTTSETVTVTQAGGAAISFAAYVIEILGASTTAPLDVSDAEDDGSALTSHPSANPGITTGSDGFVFSVAAGAASFGTRSVTSSPAFTSLTGDLTGATGAFAQYYSNATGLSSNTVTWTSTNSVRAENCVASFLASAAPAGPPTGSLSLLGVGK